MREAGLSLFLALGGVARAQDLPDARPPTPEALVQTIQTSGNKGLLTGLSTAVFKGCRLALSQNDVPEDSGEIRIMSGELEGGRWKLPLGWPSTAPTLYLPYNIVEVDSNFTTACPVDGVGPCVASGSYSDVFVGGIPGNDPQMGCYLVAKDSQVVQKKDEWNDPKNTISSLDDPLPPVSSAPTEGAPEPTHSSTESSSPSLDLRFLFGLGALWESLNKYNIGFNDHSAAPRPEFVLGAKLGYGELPLTLRPTIGFVSSGKEAPVGFEHWRLDILAPLGSVELGIGGGFHYEPTVGKAFAANDMPYAVASVAYDFKSDRLPDLFVAAETFCKFDRPAQYFQFAACLGGGLLVQADIPLLPRKTRPVETVSVAPASGPSAIAPVVVPASEPAVSEPVLVPTTTPEPRPTAPTPEQLAAAKKAAAVTEAKQLRAEMKSLADKIEAATTVNRPDYLALKDAFSKLFKLQKWAPLTAEDWLYGAVAAAGLGDVVSYYDWLKKGAALCTTSGSDLEICQQGLTELRDLQEHYREVEWTCTKEGGCAAAFDDLDADKSWDPIIDAAILFNVRSALSKQGGFYKGLYPVDASLFPNAHTSDAKKIILESMVKASFQRHKFSFQ